MLEREVAYRASEQSQDLITRRMVFISNNTTHALQLFELFSNTNFDICYTRKFDETLISAVKPQFIIYNLDLSSVDMSNRQQLDYSLHSSLKGVLNFNLPIILLLEEAVYLALAPIDIPNVKPIIWSSNHDQLLSVIDQVVEEHSHFAKFQDGIIYKDLVIDTRRMIVRQNNQRVELTKTEYDLLVYFIGSEGVVQTREALLEKVWKLQFFEGSNIVDVHIKSLRKKLNDSAVDSKYIVTVRGVGYRLADL